MNLFRKSSPSIVPEDRVITILNQLKDNIDKMEQNTKKQEGENKRLLSSLYDHCKGMSEKLKFLESKLYEREYQ